MLDVIFTLDYEIHGSGEGSPPVLMVEPTRRLMRSLERHGAKLTIMADVAEIARFKEYAETAGEDRFGASEIEDQLREAAARSHDVQLHMHSSYYGSRFENGRWVQNWAQYDLARLGYERLAHLIGEGKSYLEALLKPVRPGYACVAFRAANWSMQPSPDIVRALIANGIRIDTSVFKWGSRSSLVRFDYANAFSRVVPWPVDETDVCSADPSGELWEVPICCENRRIWHFLSWTRLYRVWQARAHPLAKPDAETMPASGSVVGARRRGVFARRAAQIGFAFGRHPWKMDFNQCSGRQLVGALKRVESEYAGFPHPIPVVLIGHSKLYTPHNEKDLESFLRYVASGPTRYRFSTLAELDPEAMRAAYRHELGANGGKG